MSIHQGDFNGDLEDLLWIPKLKNVKTLVLSDLNIKSDYESNVQFSKPQWQNLKDLSSVAL